MDITTNSEPGAPPPTPSGFVNPKAPIGIGWDYAWRVMRNGGAEYQDAAVLAAEAAEVAGLKPVTMMGVFSRARKAGLIEQELRSVAGSRGGRTRSFYRIPQP